MHQEAKACETSVLYLYEQPINQRIFETVPFNGKPANRKYFTSTGDVHWLNSKYSRKNFFPFLIFIPGHSPVSLCCDIHANKSHTGKCGLVTPHVPTVPPQVDGLSSDKGMDGIDGTQEKEREGERGSSHRSDEIHTDWCSRLTTPATYGSSSGLWPTLRWQVNTTSERSERHQPLAVFSFLSFPPPYQSHPTPRGFWHHPPLFFSCSVEKPCLR